MIAYLRGKITFRSPTLLIVEVHGIGYWVYVSLNTSAALAGQEEVRLLVYQHIREDQQKLYGFASEEERFLFEQLISVSGIGPGTAQLLLSGMTAEEARMAILTEDVQAFKSVKGIGPKTAKRVILDLKDKLVKHSGETTLITSASGSNTLKDEALSALLALGFSKAQALKAINSSLKAEKPPTTVEELVKSALGLLH
ncbi:MAG TPA: Holliday junction branch migration protein RuvA [Phaeodactylibacter sp.]|nr:Holliday junction branch migration protein RuvA [Phaeodactylibacter sp.]